MKPLKTIRGYLLWDVASALQKGIRRGDARLAGYWAIEMAQSGYAKYAWRRLLTISAEDCFGLITQEIVALQSAWEQVQKPEGVRGRVFLAKAVLVLAGAEKCRDADHLTNLMYDREAVDPDDLLRSLAEGRDEREELPEYTFDCHTPAGRRAGKTKGDFFVEEHAALKPRASGLFDDLIEGLVAERAAASTPTHSPTTPTTGGERVAATTPPGPKRQRKQTP